MKKNNEILSMLISKESYHLLFKFDKFKHHVSFSDAKFKKLLSNIIISDKEKVSIEDLLNNINRFPSERKFNLLNKYFDFVNHSNEMKAELLVNIFFSGKEKIFKRSLQLLGKKEVLELMIGNFSDYFINNINNYNNITGNIKLLMFFSPEELKQSFNSILVKCVLDDKQKNINPIFSSDIQIENNIEILNKCFDIIRTKERNIYYYNKNKYLNIISENDNFNIFLNKTKLLTSESISKVDKINIFCLFLSKHNDPFYFIKKIKDIVNLNDFFNDKDLSTLSTLFKYLIDYNIEQSNSIKRFKKNIDSLFEIINNLDVKTHNFYISNLKEYDHVIEDNIIKLEPDIKNYYYESFIKSLNNHLTEKNHIDLSEYKKTNKENILEHFYILKEKESLQKELINSDNQNYISKSVKRI